jgi:hypothetical protein
MPGRDGVTHAAGRRHRVDEVQEDNDGGNPVTTTGASGASIEATPQHRRQLVVIIEVDESQLLRPAKMIGGAPGSPPGTRAGSSSLSSSPLEDPPAAPTCDAGDGGEAGDGSSAASSSDPDPTAGIERDIARILKVPIQGWVETLLVRPAFSDDRPASGGAASSPGLVACHVPPQEEPEPSYGRSAPTNAPAALLPNVRATRLAMACGHLNLRLYGTVVLKAATLPGLLKVSDVEYAACLSPDLRPDIPASSSLETAAAFGAIPEWLGGAAQHYYHDRAVLQRLTNAMTRPPEVDDDDVDDDNTDDKDDDTNARERSSPIGSDNEISGDGSTDEEETTSSPLAAPTMPTLVARGPLCLHCRRPASALCAGCQGAYFCAPPAKDGEDPASSSCQVQGCVMCT